MKVPYLDLGAQYRALKREIDAAVIGVLDSTQFILGPEVAARVALVRQDAAT